MLNNWTRKIVVLCAMLYVGYFSALIGLELFYFGAALPYLQGAVVWLALVVFAFLDRKFELI